MKTPRQKVRFAFSLADNHLRKALENSVTAERLLGGHTPCSCRHSVLIPVAPAGESRASLWLWLPMLLLRPPALLAFSSSPVACICALSPVGLGGSCFRVGIQPRTNLLLFSQCMARTSYSSLDNYCSALPLIAIRSSGVVPLLCFLMHLFAQVISCIYC